jgi:CheY-like chemotaxis protein
VTEFLVVSSQFLHSTDAEPHRFRRKAEGRMTTTRGTDYRLRVLVVDDDPDTTISTATLLLLYGYDPRVALDSLDAINIASVWQPDVALLDIAMPHTDGLQLARSLREVAGPWRLEFIVVTGVTGAEYRAQAKAAGFRDYLLKPVELSALFRALDAIASRDSHVPRPETMPGVERISMAARAGCPSAVPLEKIVLADERMLRVRYIVSMSSSLAARTRAEFPATRSLIARWHSAVQEGRRRIARGEAKLARIHPWAGQGSSRGG